MKKVLLFYKGLGKFDWNASLTTLLDATKTASLTVGSVGLEAT